jgi:hypothetical protein
MMRGRACFGVIGLPRSAHGQSAPQWGGYVILWWKGDHEPRPIHVKTAGGRKLGRVDVATLRGLEGWTPERKLVCLLESLKREGRR